MKSGKVALIGGISGDVTSGARLDGFKEAVDGKLDIVQTTAADWERQKALDRSDRRSWTRTPTSRASSPPTTTWGSASSRPSTNAGKTEDVKVISVDGNEDALKSVKDGGLLATVAQYPYAIGQLGVQACEKAAKGDELPKEVVSPTAVVTADKADQALAKFPAPFEAFENPLK